MHDDTLQNVNARKEMGKYKKCVCVCTAGQNCWLTSKKPMLIWRSMSTSSMVPYSLLRDTTTAWVNLPWVMRRITPQPFPLTVACTVAPVLPGIKWICCLKLRLWEWISLSLFICLFQSIVRSCTWQTRRCQCRCPLLLLCLRPVEGGGTGQQHSSPGTSSMLTLGTRLVSYASRCLGLNDTV